MKTFDGFDITKTDSGLTIHFKIQELFILNKMLLSAKFPPDYIFDTNYLLNPYLNQLLDAITTRLSEVPSLSENTYVVPQADPFVQAIFAAIDDYIEHNKGTTPDRDELLRTAFKPHKVKGFS